MMLEPLSHFVPARGTVREFQTTGTYDEGPSGVWNCRWRHIVSVPERCTWYRVTPARLLCLPTSELTYMSC
jgi:hypothetical protein